MVLMIWRFICNYGLGNTRVGVERSNVGHSRPEWRLLLFLVHGHRRGDL